MAEQKNDFLSNLARKPLGTKMIILVVVLGLLFLAYRQFFAKPVQEEADSLEKKVKSRLSERDRLEKQVVEFRKMTTDKALKDLTARAEANDRKLPLESDPIYFVNYIEKRKESALVTGFSYSQKGSKTVGSFVKTTIEVKVRGTFYQLLRLFHILSPEGMADDPTIDANQAPMVTIEQLSITAPKLIDGQVYMDASFLASTFHLKDGAKMKRKPRPIRRRVKSNNTKTPAGVKKEMDDITKKREDDTKKAITDPAAAKKPPTQ